MFDSLRPRGLYSPPGSSVHEIFQARVLEWGAISLYPYHSHDFFPKGKNYFELEVHSSHIDLF